MYPELIHAPPANNSYQELVGQLLLQRNYLILIYGKKPSGFFSLSLFVW